MLTLEQFHSGLANGSLARAHHIRLSDGLTEFPDALYQLADTLEILDLSGNRLSTLPDDLTRFARLRILFASNNPFSELPRVLGRMPQLEMVGFKACRITHVPEDSLPARLRWLILTDNHVHQLPESMGRCTRLQKLMLSCNQLRQLPQSLEHCQALELLPSLAVPTASGKSVALSQVATLEYGFEEGVIWRRDRLPTVTILGDIYGNEQPATLVKQIMPTLEPIRAALPDGYLLEVGGTVEDSARGQKSVNAGVPLFILVVLTLLMLQLKSMSRTAMVFVTAPLGLIGVTLFLLVFQQPFGFVAMLGTIALSGMIMRNSVILVDQIEQDIAAGQDRWHAIIEATVRRFRPIVLTALAAVLAMIPLSRSVFFGPMAVAIMGGLIVATALTLLFLPALYAAWFRVKEVER